jgi:hypothetical protein
MLVTAKLDKFSTQNSVGYFLKLYFVRSFIRMFKYVKISNTPYYTFVAPTNLLTNVILICIRFYFALKKYSSEL